MPKQYPRDLRERAVRLVLEHRGDYATEWEAIVSIATKLGIGGKSERGVAPAVAFLEQRELGAGNAAVPDARSPACRAASRPG
jgi:hypothetical protein